MLRKNKKKYGGGNRRASTIPEEVKLVFSRHIDKQHFLLISQ